MSSTGPTILNVNDDEPTRYAVTRTLRNAGFRVEEAADGGEALRKMALAPDLLILDVNLPDIDGFEVCQRIRQDPANAGTPVILLSAHFVESGHRAHGLEAGSDYYLVQPVEPRELLATVQAMLRIRRAEREARTLARQWQATFDGITDGLCLLDREGRVLRANRAMAAFLGRSLEELIGTRFHELLSRCVPEAPPLSTASGRQVQECNVGERTYRITTDGIHGEDGGITGAVSIVSDISDQKRAEAFQRELREKSSLVERLQREMALMEGVAQRFNESHPAN